MTVALLDINDSNLQLWQGGRALHSPGYALLDGGAYNFGSGARAVARLHPRQINTRFWWQLNTKALQPALGPARHTADLVHAHLLDIHKAGGEPGEIVLSVSSSMQRDQLALVLGIIEQCPFNAVGLVNRSVALASQYPGAGRLYHLEIQLHQAMVSELVQGSSGVELKRSIPLPGCGLLQLQERLVEMIAAAFIRQTRFDPRRKAETEQVLYDALPDALLRLQNASETNMEVGGYRARIVASELATAGDRLFNSAPEAMGVLAPGDRVLLDPLAGLLPGLREYIPLGEVLDAHALPRAVNPHLEALVQRTGTLNFITTLPCATQHGNSPAQRHADDDHSSDPAAPAEPSELELPPAPEPTHLLRGALACPLQSVGVAPDPIGQPELELYREDDQWLMRGFAKADVLVNGLRYASGTALKTGDVITSSGGEPSVLIAVQP